MLSPIASWLGLPQHSSASIKPTLSRRGAANLSHPQEPPYRPAVTSPTTIGWAISPRPVDYEQAIRLMEERAAQIAAGEAGELIWLLEHPPLYTAGTSARDSDLLDTARFPVYRTGRGGQFTYHGPGQRVVYTMLDLRRRRRDVRAFVESLEHWIIATLARFEVRGETRPGRVGVWVTGSREAGGHEEKIAAIGIRVRRWIAFHGLSLNVAPDLTHFCGIVPCGIAEHGVTSLAALARTATMDEVDSALAQTFATIFQDTVLSAEEPPDRNSPSTIALD